MWNQQQVVNKLSYYAPPPPVQPVLLYFWANLCLLRQMEHKKYIFY